MSKRKHKDWLAAFMQYASYGEAPLKMYWWVGVSTIAGALRRRVWIDQRYFQWVPNFYIILVAPPGVVSKSTTANIGMNLLREIKGINFGPDVVTWQKLVEDMGKSSELVLNKATGEYIPMSCVTIASSEFGTFLDPEDRDQIDVLVSLWDGQVGAFKKGTKTSGNDSIENPWINLIACTTPSWIAQNFPEYMIGGGFTSRCIFVYADRKRQLVAYPANHIPDSALAMRGELIHDLECISQLVGEYTLDAEALEWGTQWYENHWRAKHHELSPEQFGGYLARKQTHIHKLAMVIAASRSEYLTIEAEHLRIAAEMVDALERDMPRVFDKIGRSTQTLALNSLCEIVAAQTPIKQIELYRRMSRKVTFQEFAQLLNSAIQAGFVHMQGTGAEAIIKRGKMP